MGRRLNQLGASPTRTSRPHAFSDPPPYVAPDTDLKMELGNSPMTLDIPSFHNYGNQSQMVDFYEEPAQSSRELPNQPDQEDNLGNFIRQSTCLSSSTDRTNGTLHRVLHGYSNPYIKAVGRLIKRYTATNIQGSAGMSPISEFMTSNRSWLDDDDAPPSLPNKPYYLPGDYLNLDLLMNAQPRCFPNAEQHMNRACLCFAESEKHCSPWVTPNGLSATGLHIIHFGTAGANLGDRDAFDNTVLHFMAARAPIDVLYRSIASHYCDPILNSRNTAGQTFLHLISISSIQDHYKLCQLLDLLVHKNFNLYSQDLYGRNFFHMMVLTEHVFPAGFLDYFDAPQYLKRDAFDVTPVSISDPRITISRANTLMDLDAPNAQPGFPNFSEANRDAAIAEESRLLSFVMTVLRNQTPLAEDIEGRNALQCLAAATLSKSSVLKKYGMPDPQMQGDRKGKKVQEPKDLDSCTERLKLRLELVQNLLKAGVDPNHYDQSGHTPLMAFAALLPEDDDYKYGPKILETLIDFHAVVNARSRTGETALHIAVRCGRKLAARTLVQSGANVHVRDAAGRGLLDVADVKTSNAHSIEPKEYVHYEACRAWLSGKGFAVQDPSVLQEWGSPNNA